MREEIKFRAWDTREEKMMQVGTVSWRNGQINGVTDKDEYGGEYIPACRLELMQFTGLKDKNEKEIIQEN